MTTLTAAIQKELADAFASAKSGPATARQNSPFPKPTLRQAVNDVLDPWLAEPSGGQVDVSFDSMLTSDLIALSFNDDETFKPLDGSAFKKVTFTIPAAAIAASVGKTVPVMYAVIRPNGTTVSDTLNLQVTPIAQTRLPTPAITQAVGNVLDLTTFTGVANLVVGKWPLAVVGQRVWLTVSGPGGVPTYKLLEAYPINAQEVGAGIARDIPRAELEKFADGSQLTVTCKVAFDGAMNELSAITFPTAGYTIKKQAAITFEDFGSLPTQRITLKGQTIECPTMTIRHMGEEDPDGDSGIAIVTSFSYPGKTCQIKALNGKDLRARFNLKQPYLSTTFVFWASAYSRSLKFLGYDENSTIISTITFEFAAEKFVEKTMDLQGIKSFEIINGENGRTDMNIGLYQFSFKS
jgi:hypothetical protein